MLYYVTMHMRIWTYAFVFCLRKKKLSENRTNRYVTVKRIFSAILMWSWPQERTNLPVSSRIWNFGWTTQPFSWNGKKGQGLPQLFPCVKRLCFSLFLLMRLMWTSFFLDRESYNSKQKKSLMIGVQLLQGSQILDVSKEEDPAKFAINDFYRSMKIIGH